MVFGRRHGAADRLPLMGAGYGAQFHNEKPQFVPASGQTRHIPKTPHAKAFAAFMGGFFVSEARKNRHANATA